MKPTETRPVRFRVPRACDRCRIKKAKCDGDKPCAKCKSDNALCCLSALQRPKIAFPPGYTELVEQQNKYLTSGIVALYRRLLCAQSWNVDPVQEVNGSPLVHEILERLDVKPVDNEGHCIHPDGTVEGYHENDGNVKAVRRPKPIKPTPARIAGEELTPAGIGDPETFDESRAANDVNIQQDSSHLEEGDSNGLSLFDTVQPGANLESLSYSPGSPPSSCTTCGREQSWDIDWVEQPVCGLLVDVDSLATYETPEFFSNVGIDMNTFPLDASWWDFNASANKMQL